MGIHNWTVQVYWCTVCVEIEDFARWYFQMVNKLRLLIQKVVILLETAVNFAAISRPLWRWWTIESDVLKSKEWGGNQTDSRTQTAGGNQTASFIESVRDQIGSQIDVDPDDCYVLVGIKEQVEV